MRYKEFISDSQFKLFPQTEAVWNTVPQECLSSEKAILRQHDSDQSTVYNYSIQMATPRSWSVHDKDILALGRCEPLFVLLDLPARKRGTSPKSVEISAYRVWGLLVLHDISRKYEQAWPSELQLTAASCSNAVCDHDCRRIFSCSSGLYVKRIMPTQDILPNWAGRLMLTWVSMV